MSGDPMWAELRDRHRRAAPRYEARWGTCEVCDLGATDVVTVTGISWAECRPCITRWYVGIDALDGADVPDELLPFVFAELSECTDLSQTRKEQRPMTTKPTATATPATPTDIDPQLFQAPMESKVLHHVDRATRCRIASHVVRALAAAGLASRTDGNYGSVFDVTRAVWAAVRSQDVGNNRTVEDVLRQHPHFDSAELGRVALVLLKARDTRQVLVERLRALDAIGAAFGEQR